MPHLTELLRLLGDETRLRILHLLTAEPLTVGELQELLELSQSSVSGHLSKLKKAHFIHSVAEGSSHRYRMREDLDPKEATAWNTIKELSSEDPHIQTDAASLKELISQRGKSWVERVAGSLHRAYAPGRTWEALAHSFVSLTQLGVCVDVGAGDGSMIALLAPQAEELVCVDPSPAMIAAGEAHIHEHGFDNVRYAQATGEKLPLENNSCDTILFLQSLQYVHEPKLAIEESIRILKPGGRLLLLTLDAHDNQEAQRYGHEHNGFSHAELKQWTSSLVDVRLTNLMPESRAPRFESLVLTARKPS